jgi:hypothetical protein
MRVLIFRNSGPRFVARPTASPRTPATDRFRRICRAAGRSPPSALPGRSCRGNAQTQSVGVHLPDLDAERHQFGAAQRAGETEQQKRAIAPSAGGAVAGGEQLPRHRQRQGGGLLGPNERTVLFCSIRRRNRNADIQGVTRRFVQNRTLSGQGLEHRTNLA